MVDDKTLLSKKKCTVLEFVDEPYKVVKVIWSLGGSTS
jgi:hypothetical protein